MNKKVFWLSIIGIVISFAGGFLLANALNRKEIDDLKAEVGHLKSAPQTSQETSSDQALSDDEIRQKISEADNNPENIEFQKNLATALYRYATMKQDPKWLTDIARLLSRVYEKNPKDFNTIISLGNIYFDLAHNETGEENAAIKDKNLSKAKDFYQNGLELNPNDTNVRVDLGITYLMGNPPENEKATAEFQKVLQTDSKNERALENIVKAYTNSGKTSEAEKYLAKLKEVNSGNETLPDLEAKLEEKKNNK